MRLLTFTVTSSTEHPGFQRLARSAKYWGWDLQVVEREGWERGTYKAEQLGQLEALRKWEPENILYLDAWDTVFLGPPGELMLPKGALAFCGDTLLAEWQHTPLKMEAASFPPVGLDEFRFVNAGVIWGSAELLKELNQDYLENYPWAVNQDYYNLRYSFERTLGRSRLRVDHQAHVALNVMGVLARQVARHGNRLVYKPTDTRPLVMHSPGTALTDPVAPIPQWLEDLYA